MFAVDCPSRGGRELITTNQIDLIRNTEDGIFVHFTCRCGARGLYVTGRKARRPGVLWESHLSTPQEAA